MTEPNALEALATLVAERLSRRRAVDRITFTKAEAADAIGVSVDHLERHVLPGVRVIRSGRLILVPARELEKWADKAATLTLDCQRAARGAHSGNGS